ncbi:MAG: Flp pilus assembly protein CpaB [Thermoguttaceae bacterium]
MRRKSLLLLTLALGCGLVASIGITQVMSKRAAEGEADTGQKQTILVAMKDIATGDPITAQAVKLDPWPAEYVPAGSFTRLEDVEGRRAKTLIPANTPITENVLLGKGEQLASNVIPPGYRTIAVKVESQSAGGNLIRPGDTVDVLVFLRADPNKGIPKTQTRTILQNVKVFAVNDVWDMTSASGDKSIVAKTISLIVKPQDAELVTMASEIGSIRLVMRNPEDKDARSLPGRDASELIGEAPAGQGAEEPGSQQSVAELLELLASQKPATARPAAPEPPPAEEPKTFTVRILSGSQVTDTVLESTAETNASGPSGPPLELWRISSTTQTSMPQAPAIHPAFSRPASSVLPEPSRAEDRETTNHRKKS